MTASCVLAISMTRSTTPGRAMTSCGEVCIDKISSQARKRSASYIIATANASARLATEVIGFGSGRRSIEASYFAIRFRSISTVFDIRVSLAFR